MKSNKTEDNEVSTKCQRSLGTTKSWNKQQNEINYSTTDPLRAKKISEFILKLPGIGYGSTITDATACIGGNTKSFAEFFNKVQAIELNEQYYKILKKSLPNVKCFLEDCLDIVPKLEQNIIFLDPPWGGPEYKQKREVNLTLSGKPLFEIIKEFKKYCTFIVLKIPYNCRINGLYYLRMGNIKITVI